MQTNPRFTLGASSSGRGGLGPALVWLGGFIATGAALAIGAVLAVFATVAVAVIALFASVTVFLAGLALRARRRIRVRAADADIIEARKVGHAWVAYGWDRGGR